MVKKMYRLYVSCEMKLALATEKPAVFFIRSGPFDICVVSGYRKSSTSVFGRIRYFLNSMRLRIMEVP
jgi:hypothetical protein